MKESLRTTYSEKDQNKLYDPECKFDSDNVLWVSDGLHGTFATGGIVQGPLSDDIKITDMLNYGSGCCFGFQLSNDEKLGRQLLEAINEGKIRFYDAKEKENRE